MDTLGSSVEPGGTSNVHWPTEAFVTDPRIGVAGIAASDEATVLTGPVAAGWSFCSLTGSTLESPTAPATATARVRAAPPIAIPVRRRL